MAKLNHLIEGLKVLSKYEADGLESQNLSAEHDILYAGPCEEEAEAITTEDRRRLDELGWHFDAGVHSWARLV